jgi:hypothetical protein
MFLTGPLGSTPRASPSRMTWLSRFCLQFTSRFNSLAMRTIRNSGPTLKQSQNSRALAEKRLRRIGLLWKQFPQVWPIHPTLNFSPYPPRQITTIDQVGSFLGPALDEILQKSSRVATVLATCLRFAHSGLKAKLLKVWRRGPGSNRRIKVLQTSPLPLGYRALAGLPF